MAPDPIRQALMKKTGWSTSNVSNYLAALPSYIPKRLRLLVLAIEKDVKLDKLGVNDQDLLEAGKLVLDRKGVAVAATPAPAQASTKAPKTSQPREIKVGHYQGPLPTSMTDLANAGHRRSADAYPALSVFENSVRALIRRVLEAKFGVDWWDKAVPDFIQKKAARYMADDAIDPWHEPRGAHPLFYIGFWDYKKIITDNWSLFQPILGRQAFVEETLHTINVSRRVVAHNTQLSSEDAKLLEPTITKWMKQLFARDSLIP